MQCTGHQHPPQRKKLGEPPTLQQMRGPESCVARMDGVCRWEKHCCAGPGVATEESEESRGEEGETQRAGLQPGDYRDLRMGRLCLRGLRLRTLAGRILLVAL